MLCPKCKNTISDDMIACVHCRTKVKIVCPACKALNPLGTKKCSTCELELLKFCPACNAANIPTAAVCRKCNAAFVSASPISKLAEAVKQDIFTVEQPPTPKPIPQIQPVQQDQEIPTQRVLNIHPQDNINEEELLPTEAPASHHIIDTDGKILSQESSIHDVKSQDVEPVKQPILSKTLSELKAKPDEQPLSYAAIDDNFIDDEISLEHLADIRTEHTETIQEDTNEFVTKIDYSMLAEEPESITENEDEAAQIVDEIQTFVPEQEPAIPPDAEFEVEQEEPEIETEETISADVQEEEIPELSQDAELEGYSEPYEPEEGDNFKYYNQHFAKKTIVAALNDLNKFIIGFSAPEGFGKTIVLRHVFDEVRTVEQTWLWSECTPLTQISPMGAIQDALINYFSVSGLCADIETFKKDSKKFFATELKDLLPEETDVLINFLYPHQTAYYENILKHRDVTFDALEKLFKVMKKKGPVVLVIDDFDIIDGTSYDLILRLIYNGVIDSNFKLIITYKDRREVEGYLTSSVLPNNSYETVFLRGLNDAEVDDLVKLFLNGDDPLPLAVKKQIYANAQGSAAYVEQAISFLSELTALKIEDDKIIFVSEHNAIVIPKTFSDIMQTKLGMFKTGSPHIYKLILMAAILGSKFSIDVLLYASDLENEFYEEAIRTLVYFGYFSQVNSSTLTFKNTLMWRECYDYAKTDENYNEYNQKIYDAIAYYILANNSLKALIAQNLNSPEYTFQYWTENTKLAAYIGDIGLYVISQKQCLKALDEYDAENSDYIKNNIYERIGKLLFDSAPDQAVEFLSNAIVVAQNKNDVVKTIDLGAYLGASASLTGNYLGVIEIVDIVSKLVDKNTHPLANALIAQKKLNAICMLGNTEELINIAENDVLPLLKDAIAKPLDDPKIGMPLIYEGWFEANLTLANAYIMQGNNKGIEALLNLQEVIKLNQIENKYYWSRLQVTIAFAYTIEGNINKSRQILEEAKKAFGSQTMEADVLSRWNFVYILNKVFLKEYKFVQEELFAVVTFANNCGDEFTKNILKTILGKIIKENGNIQRALEIYNEQVTYFAKEKIAIGAMLSWYFIVEATLLTDSTEKALEIAEKALDVSKNPKINNFYFMILYKSLIAEIYMIKGDLEATKMYVEKALMLAQKYDLKYLRVKLHLLYAKYFEEKIAKTPGKSDVLMPNVYKNYDKALEIAKFLNIKSMLDDVATAQQNFKAYCQLNKIK